MPSPKIDLNSMGGEENVQAALSTNPLDETLFLALETRRGLLLEFTDKKEAEAMRFRFYRRIKHHRKKGLASFDSLIFTIEDTNLKVIRAPQPVIKVL